MSSMSMSLSPRYDLFRVEFDKTFIPEEITEKYQRVINRDTAVTTTPIDYLNESIQGIHFPGISELSVEQAQVSHNGNTGLSRLNRALIGTEPNHSNHYISPANPLALFEDTIAITFRMNQGLYNFLLLNEIILYKIKKDPATQNFDDLILYILNESGEAVSRVIFTDIHIDSLDGLDFSYSKVERQSDTFILNFKYNTIDIDFLL